MNESNEEVNLRTLYLLKVSSNESEKLMNCIKNWSLQNNLNKILLGGAMLKVAEIEHPNDKGLGKIKIARVERITNSSFIIAQHFKNRS